MFIYLRDFRLGHVNFAKRNSTWRLATGRMSNLKSYEPFSPEFVANAKLPAGEGYKSAAHCFSSFSACPFWPFKF